MGNDLYWKRTPVYVPEVEHCMGTKTHHVLAEVFEKEFSEMNELVLTTKDLPIIKALLAGAKTGDYDDGFCGDMVSIIEGINKHGSIDFTIHG